MASSGFSKAISQMASSIASQLSLKGADRQMDSRAMALLAVVLLFLTAPLELSQLAFALIGALAYSLLQATKLSAPRALPAASCSKAAPACSPCVPALPRRGPITGRAASAPRRPSAPAACSEAGGLVHAGSAGDAAQEYRQPSSQPVGAPTFAAESLEAEVDELLAQISPTLEGDKVVQNLAQIVKQILRRTIPEVEVVGFASGDLVRGTAFGVAVPEVDIVVNVSPDVLAGRLQGRFSPRNVSFASLDFRKLQKSAIRACTDRLVSGGGFKFRRSAFRGQEPKVTLLAPSSLGVCDTAVPIDFSVNSTTPLYNAALLTECGQIEPRAKSLVLLVKRWAKDRGVCHAAKGHLSPFSWTLLTIYFLQVGVPDSGGPLLPPLDGFEISSALADQSLPEQRPAGRPQRRRWAPPVGSAAKKSVAALFADLVRFYNQHFDWRQEAVSVRRGQRAPPGLALPLHIILHDDGATTEVGPSIEDPFEPNRNLGECTTAVSVARLRGELARADRLCNCQASLTELLQPWVPPERGAHDPSALEETESAEVCEVLEAPAPEAVRAPPVHPWRTATAARVHG